MRFRLLRACVGWHGRWMVDGGWLMVDGRLWVMDFVRRRGDEDERWDGGRLIC